jgi:hypothetical protein
LKSSNAEIFFDEWNTQGFCPSRPVEEAQKNLLMESSDSHFNRANKSLRLIAAASNAQFFPKC